MRWHPDPYKTYDVDIEQTLEDIDPENAEIWTKLKTHPQCHVCHCFQESIVFDLPLVASAVYFLSLQSLNQNILMTSLSCSMSESRIKKTLSPKHIYQLIRDK